MTADDLDIIVSSVAPVMREFVTHKLEGMVDLMASMERRMAALETRAAMPGPEGKPGQDGQMGPTGPKGDPGVGEKGEKGDPGKDVDPAVVEAMVIAHVEKAVAHIPAPKDGAPGADGLPGRAGKDADPALIAETVTAAVAEAVAALPAPRDGNDGTSVTLGDVEPMLKAAVADAVAALPVAKDGEPGKSVDMVEVSEMVAKAVAAIPAPKDGRSVTVDDVAPLIEAEVAKAIEQIPAPKDGVGLTGALIDREGQLVVTLSDGATKNVGPVIGRVDAEAVKHQISQLFAEWPKPKDGAPGRDGTLENAKAVYDGNRTVTLCFKDSGEPIEGGVIRFPVVLDRGVFKNGTAYEAGDGVSWGGSFWIAQQATTAKPGEAGVESRAWRLAVKKGADGKVGPVGPEGKPGPRGEIGPQGRSVY